MLNPSIHAAGRAYVKSASMMRPCRGPGVALPSPSPTRMTSPPPVTTCVHACAHHITSCRLAALLLNLCPPPFPIFHAVMLWMRMPQDATMPNVQGLLQTTSFTRTPTTRQRLAVRKDEAGTPPPPRPGAQRTRPSVLWPAAPLCARSGYCTYPYLHALALPRGIAVLHLRLPPPGCR